MKVLGSCSEQTWKRYEVIRLCCCSLSVDTGRAVMRLWSAVVVLRHVCMHLLLRVGLKGVVENVPPSLTPLLHSQKELVVWVGPHWYTCSLLLLLFYFTNIDCPLMLALCSSGKPTDYAQSNACIIAASLLRELDNVISLMMCCRTKMTTIIILEKESCNAWICELLCLLPTCNCSTCFHGLHTV